MRLSDIPIHDPYVLPIEATKTYCLYASTREASQTAHGRCGVMAYASRDLVDWQSPVPVFELPEQSWADPSHKVVSVR